MTLTQRRIKSVRPGHGVRSDAVKKSMLAVLLFALGASGCASAIRVKILVPPVDNVAGVGNVLVLAVMEDFSLDRRNIVRSTADALYLRLRKSEIYKGAHMDSYDCTSRDKAAKTTGPSNEEIRKLAAASGADAVVLVRVLGCEVRVVPPSPFSVGWGVGRWNRHWGTSVSMHTRDTYGLYGNLTARFTMVRASDLALLSDRRLPVRLSDHSYTPVGERDIRYRLSDAAAAIYMNYIDVHEGFSRRLLLESGRNPASNRGARLAYDGRMEEAAELWMEAAARDPGDPAPAFNLGVYFEIVGEHAKAHEQYLEARRLYGTSDAFQLEIEESGRSVFAIKLLHGKAPPAKIIEKKPPKPQKPQEPQKPLKDEGKKEEKLRPVPEEPKETPLKPAK